MKEMQFTATGNYSDGTTASLTATATWTTSDASIASVKGGLATGLKPGSCNITAAQDGKSGNANLEVLCRQNTQYRQAVGWWANEYYAYHKYDNPLQYQYYSQGGMPYSSQFLGYTTIGNTIGRAGCALTDTSMLLSGANFIHDPGQLNTVYKGAPIKKWYSKKDGKWHADSVGFRDGGIKWEAAGKSSISAGTVIYEDGLSTVDPTNYTSPLAISSLDSLLEQCYAVIVGIRTSTTDSTSHHYVLVIGREGSKHLINDPGWGKKYLEDFNNGNIYAMHVYSFTN